MSDGDGSDQSSHRGLIVLGVWTLLTAILTASLTAWAWTYVSPRDPHFPAHQTDNGQEHNNWPGGPDCDPERLKALPAKQAPTERERCAVAAENNRKDQAALHQAVRANDLAEQNLALTAQQARSAFVQTIATVLAFGAAALAAVFAGFAAWHAKRSADADNAALAETRKAAAEAREDAVEQAKRFNRQIELSRQNYIAEQRPWVGVYGITLGELRIDENGASLKVTLHLKNTRRTPAHRLDMLARLYAENQPEKTVEDLKRRFMVVPRHRSEEDAIACVFPQQEHITEFTAICPPEQIIAAREGVMAPSIILTLLGFVVYESELGDAPAVHATSFVYRIALTGDRRIQLDNRATFQRLYGSELQAKPWPHGWLAD